MQCMISSAVFPSSGLTFVWGPPPTTVNITVILQGFYNLSTLKLNMKDTVTVYLRNSTSPFSKVDSAKAVIDSVTFTGAFIFNNASSGMYYIEVKHRNSIETSDNQDKLLLREVRQIIILLPQHLKRLEVIWYWKGIKYCIYSGDINQDGIIDGSDLSLIDNAANDFLSGYVREDCNGDRFVDGSEYSIADNNAYNFVSRVRP